MPILQCPCWLLTVTKDKHHPVDSVFCSQVYSWQVFAAMKLETSVLYHEPMRTSAHESTLWGGCLHHSTIRRLVGSSPGLWLHRLQSHGCGPDRHYRPVALTFLWDNNFSCCSVAYTIQHVLQYNLCQLKQIPDHVSWFTLNNTYISHCIYWTVAPLKIKKQFSTKISIQPDPSLKYSTFCRTEPC